MQYTPMKGASGQNTHMDLPSNVVRAMEHLRMEGFKENDVDSRLVKKTIRYIEGQELIKAKKSEKTHRDLDKKEKEISSSQPLRSNSRDSQLGQRRRVVGRASSHEEEG